MSLSISRSQLEAVVARRYRTQGLSEEQAADKAKADLDRNIVAGGFAQEGDELVPSKVALEAAVELKALEN